MNPKGKKISDIESKEFIVSGIASEYCVKETVLELLKHGKKVSLLVEGLGFVDKAEHEKTLKELEREGTVLI